MSNVILGFVILFMIIVAMLLLFIIVFGGALLVFARKGKERNQETGNVARGQGVIENKGV
jgi:hypothetical protein